jgi:hypothetical protein
MTRDERIAKLDALAQQASDFLNEYEGGTNTFRLPPTEGKSVEDMDVDPKRLDEYDEYRADWNASAMELVKYLALLTADNCE